jgi:hypothetical protein
MSAVTRPEVVLDAVPADVLSIEIGASKLSVCICLQEGDAVKEQITHLIPASGAVVDSNGVEVYAAVPADIAAKLAALITSVNAYVAQAATDGKL